MANLVLEDIRLGIVRGISYGLFGNTDAFGHRQPVEWREGRPQAQVSVTPLFIWPIDAGSKEPLP
jgi:hypothetical protein